jgi:hypothetical protein
MKTARHPTHGSGIIPAEFGGRDRNPTAAYAPEKPEGFHLAVVEKYGHPNEAPRPTMDLYKSMPPDSREAKSPPTTKSRWPRTRNNSPALSR